MAHEFEGNMVNEFAGPKFEFYEFCVAMKCENLNGIECKYRQESTCIFTAREFYAYLDDIGCNIF